MHKTTLASALTAIAMCALCGPAMGDDDQPLYVSVDCMKSTSADYVDVERDIWQAIHQELVDRGQRNSWALYSVMYGDRSKCDYYTVTSFRGEAQLNAHPDYVEVFRAVHSGKNVSKAMARTYASRERVSTDLWVRVDRTELKPHRFAMVNLMLADDPDAYEHMESKVFKAAHQALVDDGHRSGWVVYALVSPTGSAVAYNYATVNLINEVAPVPMAEALMTANPGRDLDAMHQLLALRDHVRSETWALVVATDMAATE